MSIAKKELTYSLANMPDEMLLQQYKESKECIYLGQLYKRHAHLVYGVCLKYLKRKEDAQDMVMEIFERLIHKLPTIDINAFNKWLFIFARNECVNELRKIKSISKKEQNYSKDKKREQTFVEKEASLRLYNKENIKPDSYDLMKAVEQLNKQQQTCIQLFFFEKKRYQEIVNITGYSLKEVKSYLQNGKRQLRILLEQ